MYFCVIYLEVRKVFFILTLMLLLPLTVLGQDKLPVLKLHGIFGYDYQRGTVVIEYPDGQASDTLQASIKWRGGTTNGDTKHKHNYKVKLDTDTSLFGMRSDNNWILDAGQADQFRLRNRVAMDLWNDMARLPYYADREPKARNGVSGCIVELYLNDEYMGIYNLSENMDRKQLKIKKAKNGEVRGVLYKVKQYGYGNMNDTVDIYDNHSDTWENIEVKYPEIADNDTTDWKPLYDALNFVTFSSDEEFAAQVTDYFDMPVIVDISIFISIVNAFDNRGKNILWACYDKTESQKLTPAPWDLDCTVGQEWFEEQYRGPEILFDWQIGLTNRLTKNNVNGFNEALNARFKELRQTVLSTDSLIARYRYYYDLLKRTGAAEREEQRWSCDSDLDGREINFDNEIKYITDWITSHMEWLDQAWYPLDAWTEWWESQHSSHIEAPQRAFIPLDDNLYTLGGQRVQKGQKPRPGIYIRNGKKVIITGK